MNPSNAASNLHALQLISEQNNRVIHDIIFSDAIEKDENSSCFGEPHLYRELDPEKIKGNVGSINHHLENEIRRLRMEIIEEDKKNENSIEKFSQQMESDAKTYSILQNEQPNERNVGFLIKSMENSF
mmetsp:Transcript_1051/g.1592  ORF Transcript_1051/g.1592 Transcript_1051/m.1592 type:complete len:128 (-) Transcript_1051:60-443(-)